MRNYCINIEMVGLFFISGFKGVSWILISQFWVRSWFMISHFERGSWFFSMNMIKHRLRDRCLFKRTRAEISQNDWEIMTPPATPKRGMKTRPS